MQAQLHGNTCLRWATMTSSISQVAQPTPNLYHTMVALLRLRVLRNATKSTGGVKTLAIACIVGDVGLFRKLRKLCIGPTAGLFVSLKSWGPSILNAEFLKRRKPRSHTSGVEGMPDGRSNCR
jgi:hypothetical protein